jgi:flagellar motor switch protein FliN
MLTTANIEQIIQAATDNTVALSESLSQCFDIPRTMTPGESGVWNPLEVPPGFEAAGIAVQFEVGGVGLAMLLPESLPLPEWYTSPNDSQKARLETLAMEWAMNLFPPDLEPTRSGTVKVASLAEFIASCQPVEGAAALTLVIAEAAGNPAGTFLMVWPLASPQFEVAGPAAEPEPSLSEIADDILDIMPSGPDPFARLRELPVQVSVRLAEKKISVSQLLAISSGSLITFPKSCEALLDLYVNNARYCRGEAVKIGENFGLKINEVGTTEERISKIVN